jgi:hypothetical protein
MPHGDDTLYIGTNSGADVFGALSEKQKAFPNPGIFVEGSKYTILEELGILNHRFIDLHMSFSFRLYCTKDIKRLWIGSLVEVLSKKKLV